MNVQKRRPTWITAIATMVLFAPMVLTLQGCTDLDEEPFGVITPDQFFQTEAEIIAALAPVYAQLRTLQWNCFNIAQHTSDETLVPTRGTDWDDGGHWRQLHQHNWDPLTSDFNDCWTDAYTGVARANIVLDNLANADVPNKAEIEAELRFLRAFYYYNLMDVYGGVPVVTDAATDPDNPPSRSGRAEVFDFVESELLAVRADLPAQRDPAQFGRMTQGALDATLVRMYLNAEVFTGSVSAGGLQKGQARWQDVITVADRIINSGIYSMPDDYFDAFKVNNNESAEVIMAAGTGNTRDEWLFGLNLIMRNLHYNQIPESPWNGFATLAEVFESFDDDDLRKNMFLVGPQFSGPNEACQGNNCFATGDPLEDRVGNPLAFTPGFFGPDGNPITGNPIGVDETSGVRVLKWEIDPNRTAGNNGNEFVIFRLADIYLAKAEAQNELGQTDAAVNTLNQVRARSFEPDEPIAVVSQQEFRDAVLMERRYELIWEGTRRQDLIRHGKFNDAWEFKAASEPYRVLGPIPQVQIDANPNLSQNPGY